MRHPFSILLVAAAALACRIATADATGARAPTPTPTPTPARAAHPGPAGVKWGQSPAEVKAALSERYRFVKEFDDGPIHEQEYAGEFSGFATEAIAASFLDSRLGAFTVALRERDERPASRRWLEIVEKMADRYGEPDEISAVPTTVTGAVNVRAKAGAESRSSVSAWRSIQGVRPGLFQEIDRLARLGEWTAVAQWTFANGVVVAAGVRPGEPNQLGTRTLQPFWMFVTREAAEKMFGAKRTVPSEF